MFSKVKCYKHSEEVYRAISEITRIPVDQINDDSSLLDLANHVNLSIEGLLDRLCMRLGKKVENPEMSLGSITLACIKIG